MRKKLQDRLMYVVCSQNWEAMGPHYWVKQCIELMLSAACEAAPLQNCTPSSMLPPVTGVINTADPAERAAFTQMASIKEEPSDVESESGDTVKDGDVEGSESQTDGDLGELADLPGGVDVKREVGSKGIGGTTVTNLTQMITKQHKFFEIVKESPLIHAYRG